MQPLAGSTVRRDGNDPFGEAFSFASPTEFEAFKRIRPDLFEGDGRTRRRRWIEFAQTDLGKRMRWR